MVNNLASEHQSDAWSDLAEFAGSRQRVAGQLVQSLESGLVLFAALIPGSIPGSQQQQQQQQQSIPSSTTIYSRLHENIFVSIRSIPIDTSTLANGANKSIELSFPSDQANSMSFNLYSQAGLSWWQQMDQRFNLHLQVSSASNGQQQQQQATSGTDSPPDPLHPITGKPNSTQPFFFPHPTSIPCITHLVSLI